MKDTLDESVNMHHGRKDNEGGGGGGVRPDERELSEAGGGGGAISGKIMHDQLTKTWALMTKTGCQSVCDVCEYQPSIHRIQWQLQSALGTTSEPKLRPTHSAKRKKLGLILVVKSRNSWGVPLGLYHL